MLYNVTFEDHGNRFFKNCYKILRPLIMYFVMMLMVVSVAIMLIRSIV